MINRSAQTESPSGSSCGGRRLRTAPALVLLSLALAACGNNASDEKLDARLSEMEKKVEAADKRSRQAISLAADPNSAPPPDAGGEPTFDDGGEAFDNESDFDMGESQDGVPPPPPIAPEG